LTPKASSRASPLPQWIAFLWKYSVTCGSGLAREEGRKDTEKPSDIKKPRISQCGAFSFNA